MTRLELATPRPPDLPELLMNKYYHMDVNCSRGNLQSNIPANTKLCEVCGERFEYNEKCKTLPKYCEECAKEVKMQYDRQYQAEKYKKSQEK